MKRRTFLSLMGAAALTSSMMLTGCGAGSGDDRKIVRIGHVQSQTHPDHLGLEAFANYINEKLGDKYRVGAALVCIFCPTVSKYLCFALSSRWRCDS